VELPGRLLVLELVDYMAVERASNRQDETVPLSILNYIIKARAH
jgi:hypothetical protein